MDEDKPAEQAAADANADEEQATDIAIASNPLLRDISYTEQSGTVVVQVRVSEQLRTRSLPTPSRAQVPLQSRKLLMLSLVRRVAETVVVKQVPHIDECFVVERTKDGQPEARTRKCLARGGARLTRPRRPLCKPTV
jgi:hypothetical protein